MSWTTSGDKTRGYKFAYDNLSRLTAAGYLEAGTANVSYGTSYNYDKHGNMTNLVRNGRTGTSTFGTVDNLSMSYAGNQLLKADDTGTTVTLSASMDFKNNSTAAKEYFYDLNGNLMQDLNKGITGITYNFLNLPQSVTINNTLGQATNTYTYAADGRKLRANIGSKQTDYVGNVIYESVNEGTATLKRILVDGGYIEGGVYYFYLTDHLGNNRVVANASGGIVQTNHYYPFGMSFAEGVTTSGQPYKYNGKELDTERGLNLYDYSARLMDPALGRFSTVNPSTEKYYSTSPYFYCGGNPIKFIDPNGMDWFVNNQNGNVVFVRGVSELNDKLRDKYGLGNYKYENLGQDQMFGNNLKIIEKRDVLTFDGPIFAEKFMNKQGYEKAERVRIEETKTITTDFGESGKINKDRSFDLIEKNRATTYATPDKLNIKSNMSKRTDGDIYKKNVEIETVRYDLIKPAGQSSYKNAYYGEQRTGNNVNSAITGIGLILDLLKWKR
ncbi:RHS repeat-associated core domain-containing protein [uncultured Bacteroides sp.]|uniref:RHS repeat domain-containing protein n=1 Tax=uncultured Bacteroides sp. TaxID=162156 RepID=UPI002AA8D0DF|nr:RHS repeat-associated core domain-containing protein [uncultured Bacteroides sp.]